MGNVRGAIDWIEFVVFHWSTGSGAVFGPDRTSESASRVGQVVCSDLDIDFHCLAAGILDSKFSLVGRFARGSPCTLGHPTLSRDSFRTNRRQAGLWHLKMQAMCLELALGIQYNGPP